MRSARTRKASMAACHKGHAVCKTCFEGYAGDGNVKWSAADFVAPSGLHILPVVLGRFSEQNVAQILSWHNLS